MPIELPGIALAALATLAFGAVLGPEAPLIALGGGLAVLAVRLAQRDVPAQTLAVVSAAGSLVSAMPSNSTGATSRARRCFETFILESDIHP